MIFKRIHTLLAKRFMTSLRDCKQAPWRSYLVMAFLGLYGQSAFSAPPLAAHVHGQAQLDWVISDHQINVFLETPANHVFGFENAPQTAQQRQHFKDTLAQLHRIVYVAFNSEAGCTLRSREIHVPWTADWDGHSELSATSEPSQPSQPSEHNKDNRHAHDRISPQASAASSSHQDVHITYQFDCKAPERLSALDARAVFQHWGGLERIRYQGLVSRKPLAGDLTPTQPRIRWSSL